VGLVGGGVRGFSGRADEGSAGAAGGLLVAGEMEGGLRVLDLDRCHVVSFRFGLNEKGRKPEVPVAAFGRSGVKPDI
jgi:hypothetical protein